MQAGTRAALVGAAVLTATLATVAQAGPPPTLIKVKDDKFKPADGSQLVDSSTTWDWADSVEDEHNVREDQKLFYSGQPTSDVSTQFFKRVSAGTYHYYCEEHGSRHGGMDGTMRVRPSVLGSVTDDEFPVTWADLPEVEAQFDVRFKVGDGNWKNWRKNTTSATAIFGNADDPVDVEPGRTYRVQARTEKAGTDKQSDWSPKLKVTPQP